jgi:hypothetical protein
LNANEKAGPLLNVLRISTGPNVGGWFEASKEAEKLPPVKEMNYELRVLYAPTVHFYAVWLHRKADDIMIPLDPGSLLPNELVPNRAYSEDEVSKILQPIAEERIKAVRNAGPTAVF